MNRDSNRNKKKEKIEYRSIGNGLYQDQYGNYYDQYRQRVDKYGRPVDKNGIPYAEYGEDGTPPQRKPQGPAVLKRSSGKRPQSGKPKAGKRRVPIFRIIAVVFIAVIIAVVLDINHLLGLYTYDDTAESRLSEHTEGGIMTLALFGVDTREEGDSGTRADAIMIMSVDPARSSIKLVSLMRDSYVEVPGYGKTKLGHAYSYGGPQLMMQTINECFGMNITEYMTVDFAQMASIIDAVGGVTVEITEEELEETNKYIDEYCWGNDMPTQRIEAAGEQKLNGIQAMTYGRIRKGDTGGDWQRTERQSVVLNQVFSKATGNPVRLLRFLHGLMPNITSSMSKSDFWYMGLKTVLHGMPSMSHLRLPLDGEWQYGTTSGGLSVVQFNNDVLAQHLRGYIFNDVTPVALEE